MGDKSVIDRVVESYDCDGFLYGIRMNLDGRMLIKIGKTGMKVGESDDSVITKLQRRYNTYYPSYEMLYFVRVCDVDNAEKYIFSLLSELRLNEKHEHFEYLPSKIEDAFREVRTYFPCILTMIQGMTPEELTVLNGTLRRVK